MSDAFVPSDGEPSAPHVDPHPERERSAYDLVRQAATRELDDAERAELEAAARSDPALAEFAAEYPALHELTEPLARRPTPSARPDAAARLEAALEAAHAAPSPLRRAAAAAVLVLAGGAAWFGARALRSEPASVKLAAIEWPAPPGDAYETIVDLPERLETYEPVRDGAIAWIDSLEEGRAIARAAERPMLLFGMYTTCPWCIDMQQNGLRDETVLALASEFVPVRIVYDGRPEEELREYFERGYPLFELWTPEGELAHSFAGHWQAPDFVQHLDDASTADRRRAAPAWSEVRRMAAEYGAATDIERDGRYGEAYAAYSALAREASTHGSPELAREALDRLARRAACALDQASELAPSDRERALERLSASARAFAGSPFASDFEHVRDALRRTGGFPRIAPAGEG